MKDHSHSKPSLQLAALLLETGDTNAYGQLSHRSLSLFQGKVGGAGTTVVRISKLGLLAPLNPTDTAQAAQMAEQALTATTDPELILEAQLAKGLAECRTGHFAGAIEWMEKLDGIPTTGSHPESLLKADANAVLACAQQQLKQTDAARASLAKAKESLRAGRPDSADNLGNNWQEILIAQALLREARQLIEGTAAAKQVSQLK